MSLSYTFFSQIVLLWDWAYLGLWLFFNLFRLEHYFFLVQIHCLANKVVSLISWEKGCKKYLSMNCCYWYRIIKNNCIKSFLYFSYIFSRNLNESFTKEDVTWIKIWMKTKSLISNIKPTSQDNLITQATGETFQESFIWKILYFCSKELFMFISILFL